MKGPLNYKLFQKLETLEKFIHFLSFFLCQFLIYKNTATVLICNDLSAAGNFHITCGGMVKKEPPEAPLSTGTTARPFFTLVRILFISIYKTFFDLLFKFLRFSNKCFFFFFGFGKDIVKFSFFVLKVFLTLGKTLFEFARSLLFSARSVPGIP